MESKLQTLTEHLYRDGVAKAQLEADRLIAEAEAKAKTIVEEAEAKAEQIKVQAKKDAEELKRNTQSEIQMAANQALQTLKNSVKEVVAQKVVDAPMKELFADKDFLSAIITKAIEGFASKGISDVEVLLPAKDVDDLKIRLQKSTAGVLNTNVQVKVGAMKGGFSVGPQNGSYYVTFAEEDFANFFKSYIKSKSNEWLWA